MDRRTEWQIAMNQLKKHRLALFGFWILVFLYFLAILADFLSPYTQEFSNREKNYHPPTPLHFLDSRGRFHLRPFIHAFTRDAEGNYVAERDRRFPVYFFAEGRPYRFLFLFPLRRHLFGVREPATIFLFGSDNLGRDLFSRVLYGSRVALSIGLVGIAVSFTLGLLLGGISGYYGGIVDNILQRFGEVLMTFPSFYLLLALRGVIPENLPSTTVYFMIVFILSFIRWPGVARIVRGMVLSLKETEFVQASRALGCRDLYIIVRHILPNTISQVLVLLTLSIPGFIIGEAALSFLDLGIREPQASWGNMLYQAQDIAALTQYPWILIPGLFLTVTVLAFNFLGDGLRDALDPKMRIS